MTAHAEHPAAVLDRFWAKVNITEHCWLWAGATNGRKGYGVFYPPGQKIYAHRVAYEITYGEIPAGLVIDHTCCEPSCVRPDHLEVVTNAENIRRGGGGKPLGAPRTRELALSRREAAMSR